MFIDDIITLWNMVQYKMQIVNSVGWDSLWKRWGKTNNYIHWSWNVEKKEHASQGALRVYKVCPLVEFAADRKYSLNSAISAIKALSLNLFRSFTIHFNLFQAINNFEWHRISIEIELILHQATSLRWCHDLTNFEQKTDSYPLLSSIFHYSSLQTLLRQRPCLFSRFTKIEDIQDWGDRMCNCIRMMDAQLNST